MRRRIVWVIAPLLMGQSAAPLEPSDPRIRSVVYSADRIVPLPVQAGYALVVELSEDERIDNVVVGNSAAWQVTSNKRGDHLIIKRTAAAGPTDLVVTTDSRRYVFLLQPSAQFDAAPFVVRLTYPDAPPDASPVPVQESATFRFRGDRALYPAAMSDDGKRTSVQWDQGTPIPAMFAIDPLGREALVNGRMAGGVYVVESVADRFVFRVDHHQAIAIRRPVRNAR